MGRCYSITVFFLDALFLLAFFSARASSASTATASASSAPVQTARLGAHRVKRVNIACFSAWWCAHGGCVVCGVALDGRGRGISHSRGTVSDCRTLANGLHDRP